MKKLLSLFLTIIVVAAVFAGCSKENKGEKPSADVPSANATVDFDYSKATAEDIVAQIKDISNITVDEYMWLIGTYANVPIDDELKLEDNITDEAFSILYAEQVTFPSISDKISELLSNEAPQIRGYAFSKMGSLFGMSADNVKLSLDELSNETELYVINCGIKALANEGSKDGVGEFLTQMSKHENAIIRCSAANALANSWSTSVANVVDIVIGLMNDSDEKVCEAACSGAGNLGDEKVIEPLVEILKDTSRANLHAACVKSLCTLWYDYPFHDKTSEKAYKATIEYWKTTPRTKEIPAWNSLSNITSKATTNDSFAEWEKKATYFNTDELYNVMLDIVKDGNADWLARTGAIDVVMTHCSSKQIKALGPVIEKLDDSDASLVLSSYNTKLEQLENDN